MTVLIRNPPLELGLERCLQAAVSQARPRDLLPPEGGVPAQGRKARSSSANSLPAALALMLLTLPAITAAASTLTVLNTNDNGAGSLRAAIASATNGDSIVFAANVTGVITLATGELAIGNSLAILGPGAKVLTVSGGNASRVFNIVGGTVAISGLTIATGRVSAPKSGGGVANAGTLTLSQCVIASNSVARTMLNGFGGGIANSASLVLNQCALFGNSANEGGGLYSPAGSVAITNCTCAANTAIGLNGGGIYTAGALTLVGVTVSANTAGGNGGGIYWSAGSASLADSLVAGNAAASGPDLYGAFTSLGYNLIGASDGSVGFSNGVNEDQVGTSASPIDPQLGSLADNGGPTPTMALLFGSPAIDQGKRFGMSTDQRGQTRPFDFGVITNATGGDGSDIGAYEFLPPVLQIQRASGATVILSWPTNALGFNLQSEVALSGPPTWSPMTNIPVAIGLEFFITNNATAGAQFYRLSNP